MIFRAGGGNVVIVRHLDLERGNVEFVDSSTPPQRNRSAAKACLSCAGKDWHHRRRARALPRHFALEMRKNTHVGMFSQHVARDYLLLLDPSQFVMTHQSRQAMPRPRRPNHTFPNQSELR